MHDQNQNICFHLLYTVQYVKIISSPSSHLIFSKQLVCFALSVSLPQVILVCFLGIPVRLRLFLLLRAEPETAPIRLGFVLIHVSRIHESCALCVPGIGHTVGEP